jgi:hypothetical protein
LKSTVTHSPTPVKEPSYPVLKKRDGGAYVVLFISPKQGVVVHNSGSVIPVGYYADDWCEAYFTTLPEDTEITISNA